MQQKGKYNCLKIFTIFCAGAFAYGLIEIAARGFTHISMGLLGGLAMLVLHKLNSFRRTPVRVFTALVISAVFITFSEFITGEIVNVRMGLGIWDYSDIPLNYDGQICLPFSLIWFALSSVGLMFDDLLRIKVFNEYDRESLFMNKRKQTAV